jgi:subtilisin family serine protease
MWRRRLIAVSLAIAAAASLPQLDGIRPVMAAARRADCPVDEGMLLADTYSVPLFAAAQSKTGARRRQQQSRGRRTAVVSEIFHRTDAIARVIHGVDALQTSRPDLIGTGVRVAVVDAFAVWPDHPQLFREPQHQRRVALMTQESAGDHATHVAGTIASAGLKSDRTNDPVVPAQYGPITAGEASRGIATDADVVSYAASDCDYAGAVQATDISNYSIAGGAGWERDPGSARLLWMGPPASKEDPRFGRYDVSPSYIDGLVAGRPSHVVVTAAGNDQDFDQSPASGTTHWHVDGLMATDKHNPDKRNGGLRTVHSWCVAKNVLCVGSIEDRDPGAAIRRSAFSNLGPTDDGRVKPDVVANGSTIMSLLSGPSPARLYESDSGTSSATPNVTGIAALVLQELRNRHQTIPHTAALVKALLIHTAEDAGPRGPDPEFGWGMVRAAAAVYLLASATVVSGVDILADSPVRMCFMGDAGARPRVTVAWIDPAGPVISGTDDPTPVLVNDVDAELHPPSGAALLPWVFNGTTATTGPNHVDNVEVIDTPDANAAPGRWQLVLQAHHFGVAVAQPVALIVSGLKQSTGC